MPNLELKIPPLILVLIFGTLMWLFHLSFTISLLASDIALILLLFFVSFGLIIIISGVLVFQKAQTTVNPTKPETSSSLVKSGIYNFTRNPMYVGMASVLTGWGFYLSNPGSLAFMLGFILYMNHFQIRPEEKVLTRLFGQEFVDYCTTVRRWL
jgi:protein-S-isoprenylcysteine O-methyltransferase Ste14